MRNSYLVFDTLCRLKCQLSGHGVLDVIYYMKTTRKAVEAAKLTRRTPIPYLKN